MPLLPPAVTARRAAKKAAKKGAADAAAADAAAAAGEDDVALAGATLASFVFGPVLGHGSFGRVTLARHTLSGRLAAVKALSKAHLVRTGQAAHVQSEAAVLAALGTTHPAFIRLLAHFQDDAFVYLVLEYAPGGEFFRHLRARGRLAEPAARFYAAEVAAALDAMHSKGIVYRDLKPENLLLDADGHIKVADMGFAKLLPRGGRTYTLCGTPDYIAPEVVLNAGHGRGADWWSFGVLVYEMLAGYPPFYDADTGETYRKIVDGGFTTPPHFSAAAKDLVTRLLTADLSRRLGCVAGGAADVKAHAWFRGVDWSAVAARRGDAPIVPRKAKGKDDGAAAAANAGVDAGAAVNFDDYSALPPLDAGDAPLTKAEQALFVGL